MSHAFDSTKMEQFKVFKFSEDKCYYGETAWVDSTGKIIEDLSSFPGEEKKYQIRHGNGIEVYGKTSSGDISRYEGQWDHNKKSGKGKCIFLDGSYYIGEYHNNCINGKGTFTWSNGATYNGEWIKGRMSGQGEYKNNKIVHKGTFINGYYLDVSFI